MRLWVFDPSESKSTIPNSASTISISGQDNNGDVHPESSSESLFNYVAKEDQASIDTCSSAVNFTKIGNIHTHKRKYVARSDENSFNTSRSSAANFMKIGNSHTHKCKYVARSDENSFNTCRSSVASCDVLQMLHCEVSIKGFFTTFQLENLPSMVAGVRSDEDTLQFQGIILFRELLSIGRNPPIKEVIETGVIPRFVEFLGREDFPKLQFEAVWVLTNIASGTSEHTRVVIDHGAVLIFVKLLASPCDDVREKAAWALGTIAADSIRRDLVLCNGALLPLLAQLNEHTNLSMLRNATRTLSNFCRGKPPPPFKQLRPALPVLQQLLHLADEKVLADACWALYYLSNGTNDQIQAVIEAGVGPRLVKLLLHPNTLVLVPALRAVRNIARGSDIQTQCVIDYGAIPYLLSLLTHNHHKISIQIEACRIISNITAGNREQIQCVINLGAIPYLLRLLTHNHHKMSIKIEACRIMSNITAGNREQIQAVIEAGCIAPLVNLIQNAEFDLKKRAIWAIANATSHGTNEQIQYLVSQGCIKPLCDLLICHDPKIVYLCLKWLKNILKVGAAEKNSRNSGDTNKYAQMIDEAGGVEKLESLQSRGVKN